MCTASRLLDPPAHFTQRWSSRRAGAEQYARWAAVRGGGSSELQVLERWWRGLGVGYAYRWSEEREALRRSCVEGDADMARQWWTWWRSGIGSGAGGAWRWGTYTGGTESGKFGAVCGRGG